MEPLRWYEPPRDAGRQVRKRYGERLERVRLRHNGEEIWLVMVKLRGRRWFSLPVTGGIVTFGSEPEDVQR